MSPHIDDKMIETVQDAVIDAINVCGVTLIGSGFEQVTASPIPDVEIARIFRENVIEPKQANTCHGTMTEDELMDAWRRDEPVDEARVNEILGRYCGRGPCWLEGGHEGKCIPG